MKFSICKFQLAIGLAALWFGVSASASPLGVGDPATAKLFQRSAAGGGGVVATDDFNRTDNASLGASWGTLTTGVSSEVFANTARGVVNDTSLHGWNANAFANNQYAKVTLDSDANLNSGTRYAGAAVRLTGTGGTRSGYAFYTDGASGSGHTEIVRIDNGTTTAIKAISTTFTSGDVIELRASGTSLSAYKNGSLLDSVTDATYGSGDAGFMQYGQTRIDAWEGGDL